MKGKFVLRGSAASAGVETHDFVYLAVDGGSVQFYFATVCSSRSEC